MRTQRISLQSDGRVDHYLSLQFEYQVYKAENLIDDQLILIHLKTTTEEIRSDIRRSCNDHITRVSVFNLNRVFNFVDSKIVKNKPPYGVRTTPHTQHFLKGFRQNIIVHVAITLQYKPVHVKARL